MGIGEGQRALQSSWPKGGGGGGGGGIKYPGAMFDSLNQSEKEGAAGGQTRTRCKWCLEFNTPYIIGGTCAAMIQTHRQTSRLQVRVQTRASPSMLAIHSDNVFQCVFLMMRLNTCMITICEL